MSSYIRDTPLARDGTLAAGTVLQMVPLVAILGAGASRGSGRFRESRVKVTSKLEVPPLTVDLFDESKYAEVLRTYDLAHQAGRFIAEERAQDDALGLESALHRLATSQYPHHQHMAVAVPPYLQHLLLAVSEQLYSDALHYDRLIERLLCLPYVHFVSLNYDVMLDRRLSAHRPLSTLADYVSDDTNWSLIKPHGSVNWFHEADETFLPATPPLDLSWRRDTFGCVPPHSDLNTTRGPSLAYPELTNRYPALAAPEGPDDKLVLPGAHHDFFFDRIHRAQQIDMLVIGYSGLDREILKLIKRIGPKIRHMTVVSQDQTTASAVLERFRAAGLDPIWNEVIDGDFASWSNGGGLTRLVDDYDGPYTRAA
jgi:hypothetical protein